jgi:hypothetical protein
MRLPKGEGVGAKKERLKYSVAGLTRQGTIDWLSQMSNAMRCFGKRWHHFADQDELLLADRPLKKPRFLTICSDNEGTQTCGLNGLKGEGVFVEHIPGPMHLRGNAQFMGFKESGHYQRINFNVGKYNVRYGPYQKNSWGELLKETALEISMNMSPNDPVLVHFYKGHLQDIGKDPDQNTELNRKQFLEALPSMPIVTSKPKKASVSRTNAYEQAFRFHDTANSADQLIKVCCSLMQGWSKYADEFWAIHPTAPPDAIVDVDGVDAGVVPACGIAASSSSSAASSVAPKVIDVPAAPSKAAAKAAAKAQQQLLVSKAQNTLHAYARDGCDDVALAESRIIGYMMGPQALSMGNMLKHMRSGEHVQQFYSEWSHWSWVDDLKRMVDVLSDTGKLEKIGFTVHFPMAKKAVDTSDGNVAWENRLANNLARALQGQVKHLTGAMVIYVLSGQLATAGLLHKEPGLVQERIKFFERVHKADVAAGLSGHPTVVKMTDKSSYNTPLLKWVRKAFVDKNFESLHPMLSDVLGDFWHGLFNEKMVEDLNKCVREKEQRDSNHKNVAAMDAWAVGSQHQLVSKYNRTEVEPSAAVEPPSAFDWSGTFAAHVPKIEVETLEQKRERELLEKVQKAKFETYNVASHQDQTMDATVLICDIHENHAGNWTMADDAWVSEVVPEGKAVRYKHEPRLEYVVRSYKNTFVTWPLTCYGEGKLFFDMDVKKLTFRCVYSMDDIQVQDIALVSPLSIFAEEQLAKVACRFQKYGPLQSLEAFHIANGFQNLSEACLRKLLHEYDFTEPDLTDPECQKEVEVCLATHLLMGLDKGITADEAKLRIIANRIVEGIVDCPEMTHEMMRDTVLEGDRDEILKTTQQAKDGPRVGKRTAAIQLAVEMAADSFKALALAPSDKAVKTAKVKPATKKVALAEKKRLYVALNKDADIFVQSNLPLHTTCFTDNKNGRWRCTNKVLNVGRSFSWTNLGSTVAAMSCLRLLWDWSEEASTGVAPVGLADIMKEHGF